MTAFVPHNKLWMQRTSESDRLNSAHRLLTERLSTIALQARSYDPEMAMPEGARHYVQNVKSGVEIFADYLHAVCLIAEDCAGVNPPQNGRAVIREMIQESVIDRVDSVLAAISEWEDEHYEDPNREHRLTKGDLL